jgi:Flp pilus assembly protein TadD
MDLEAPPPRSSGGLPGWAKPVAAIVAAAVAAGAVLAYRSHHRDKVLRQGLTQARLLLRADTAAGYREAARLLEPLAKMEPVEAGALRAQSLAMLALDYRDARAGQEAEALLVEPGRAAQVPEPAQAAYAALALSRQEAGNAATFAARAASPAGLTLQARTALLAGNLGAANESLARAVEADPTLPAALALQGDVLRRAGKPAEARRAYLEALAASPTHPRAALGLGKLALSGQADAATAREPLSRLLDDREGTPGPERARAALHLASVLARSGDRAGAAAAVDKAGLDGPGRAWLERAAAEQELQKGPYRVVRGAPPPLQSTSDDDPYVPPPPPPPRAEPERPAAKKAPARPAKKAKKKAPAKKPTAKKGAKAKPKAKPKKKAPARKPAAAKKPAPTE